MRRRGISTLLILVLIGAVWADPNGLTASTQTPPARTQPPTLEELKSATFTGLKEVSGPVKLQNGRWNGTPSAPGASARPTVELASDFIVTGDLDGDGANESIVVLTYSSGGSGVFSYIAVTARRDGTIRNIATAALGDRVQLKSVRVDSRKLLVSGVRAGANDAACCPGELVDWQWTLSAGRLNSPGAVRTGRLTLATLAGSEWVLRAWDINEPAVSQPAVTLAYNAGRLAGNSGCNRYSGAVTAGARAGEISVGLLAGTRMACPAPQDSVETRFLEQLSGSRTFGFMLGRLMISYVRTNGTRGTMLFDLKVPSK